MVRDIATDPLWADFRDLALAHGLRACWSTPVRSSEGKVLGTFAIYYREPRSPTAQELGLIEQVTISRASPSSASRPKRRCVSARRASGGSSNPTSSECFFWDLAGASPMRTTQFLRTVGLLAAGSAVRQGQLVQHDAAGIPRGRREGDRRADAVRDSPIL